MCDVIGENQEEKSSHSVDEMVLKRIPAKQLVDNEALGNMNEEEVCHLVVYYECNLRAVVTKLLFDSLDFTIDLIHVGVNKFFSHEQVNGLVNFSEKWVLWSCHELVVTLHVNVFEMEIEYLGV